MKPPQAPDAGGGTDAWVATLQGAREYAEDRHLACPPFFAVVDGHGGTAAANDLIAIMRQRAECIEVVPPTDPAWWAPPRPPGAAPFDNACALLANMHTEARHVLAKHRSGAVSLCALAMPDADASAVYFACVGDVQGCVFDLDTAGGARPVSAAASLHVFDMAEEEVARLKGEDRAGLPRPRPPGPALALTAPHALRPPVLAWLTKHEAAGVTYGVPTGFEDPKSNSEWLLASRLIVQQNLLPRDRLGDAGDPPGVARHYMPVQVTRAGPGGAGHARFLANVEPTRSFGDSESVVLAHPELYALRFGPRLRGPRCLLLCSDGVLDGDAFPDLHALTAFLVDPVAWISASFYHPAQCLTQDLIAVGHLPPDLREPSPRRRSPLFNAWRLVRAQGWSAMGALLARHLQCVHRMPSTHAQSSRWLAACRDSSRWFLRHAADRPPALAAAPALAVEAAAHLAILMGSHDNVTILVAPVPDPRPAPPADASPRHSHSGG